MTEESDNWKEAYINDLRPLSESEQNRLGAVTTVGMRFYDKGRTRAWAKNFQEADNAAKCLYLVPDPQNKHDKNAIMLHDGKKLLGYVQASEAPHVAEMLQGSEDVYCVYVSQIGHADYATSEPSFLRVKAFCKVDERLARKFTCEPNSKTTPSTHKTKMEEKAAQEAAKAVQKHIANTKHYAELVAAKRKAWADHDVYMPEWQCKQYGFDE